MTSREDAAEEIAAHRASLLQLVAVALLAAGHGNRALSERVVEILHGHGSDGIYALLYGAADIALGRELGALPSPVPTGRAAREWLADPASSVHVWCARLLLARARVDPTQCAALVHSPPPGGLLPAMQLLVHLAVRTATATPGDPQ